MLARHLPLLLPSCSIVITIDFVHLLLKHNRSGDDVFAVTCIAAGIFKLHLQDLVVAVLGQC